MWIWIVIAAIVVVTGAVLALLLRRRQTSTFADADTYRKLMGVQVATPANTDAGALRQNLRVKYLYQEDKIDAAIAYERERNPSATEEQLMQAAIARWERDNN